MHQCGSGPKNPDLQDALHTNHQSLFIMKHVFIIWGKLLSVPEYERFSSFIFWLPAKNTGQGWPLLQSKPELRKDVFHYWNVAEHLRGWTTCHCIVGTESPDDIWLWTSSGWRGSQAKSNRSWLSFPNETNKLPTNSPFCSFLPHLIGSL